MGDDPSQQPPDWWNMSGPCWPVSRCSRLAASSVRSTRRGSSGVISKLLEVFGSGWQGGRCCHRRRPARGGQASWLEQGERLTCVADPQDLGLLVVGGHHLCAS